MEIIVFWHIDISLKQQKLFQENSQLSLLHRNLVSVSFLFFTDVIPLEGEEISATPLQKTARISFLNHDVT